MKKNRLFYYLARAGWKKWVQIMKLTAFLILLFVVDASASFSQSTKISIKVEKGTLSEIFSKIEAQSEYRFFYQNEQIRDAGIKTLDVTNENILDVMHELLKETELSCKLVDRNIIIFPKSENPLENVIQQQKSVSGKVTDSSGAPLPGVTVIVKGTTNGTITDMNGKYSFSNISENATLLFSFVGMKLQEIKVAGKSSINVTLAEEIVGIDEVVAVGYGVQKKSDITGAMVRVDANEIKLRPVTNAIQAIQGKAAGVDITSNERPGTVGSITIRGVRSLTASNSPLYVVDGIPLTTGSIDNLNTSDIASIDILKDASATAIYGSRGANGVIIITTKQGEKGKISLNYTSSFTNEKLEDNETPMNAGEYIEFRRWAYYYSNPAVYPRGDQPNQQNDLKIFLGTSDTSAWANIMKGWENGTWDGSKVATTDWTGMVTRTGFTNEHTLSASGGTDKMKGYVSFGYLDNKGTSKGQGYTRYTGKVSFDVAPVKWVSIGGNINASFSTQEYGQSTVGNTLPGGGKSSIYIAAKACLPYTVPYDSNGNRIVYPGGDDAIKTIVNEWNYSQDQRVTYRTFGSFYSQIDFGSIFQPLNGLKYRMNFGPDFSLYRDGVYIDGLSVLRTGTSYASLTKSQTVSYTLDNMIYYDKTIGKHNLGITLLQSQTKYDYENSSMSANGIPFSSQKWNALTTTNVTQLADWSSGLTQKQLMSYMGRMNYNFANKYLITVSGRWDGASQLSEDHKWSFFPSAALGWRLDQENFLKGIKWISQLKMRMGVGVTGNSAINPYATKGGISPLFYPFGSNLTAGTITSVTMANQSLGWEKTTQYNLGLDYSLLNGRVSGIIDIYTSQTKDLLMAMSIPSLTGYTKTYANIGQTANKGMDITLSTRNIETSQFKWATDLNVSWQKDHIVSLSNGKQDDINNGWFIGQSQDVIYGYQSSGIWKEEDAAEMAKFNANGNSFQVGLCRPVDQNGDYKIDANYDRVVVGNTRPRWIVGMTNTFSYKHLELSVFLYGRLKYLYDTGGEVEGGRLNQRKINYYTENNKNSEYQKPIYSTSHGDPYYQILGYKDGSFIKVRNISLGYNVPEMVAKSWGISSLRVYVQATNPGMLYSKIDWLDMDVVSSTWNRGYTIGINVGF